MVGVRADVPGLTLGSSRHQKDPIESTEREYGGLAGLFTMLALYFVRPRPFERIVPKPLPRKRELGTRPASPSWPAPPACCTKEPAARPVWPARLPARAVPGERADGARPELHGVHGREGRGIRPAAAPGPADPGGAESGPRRPAAARSSLSTGRHQQGLPLVAVLYVLLDRKPGEPPSRLPLRSDRNPRRVP